MNFPDDVNGDVLRRMYDSGMDFSQSYPIEFFCLFSDQNSAQKAYDYLKSGYGFHSVDLNENEEQNGWDVVYTVNMVPSHQKITEIENWLNLVTEKYGGSIDGWGVWHG